MRLSRSPRQWAKPEQNFGRDARCAWQPTNGASDEIERDAAKIQHDIVLRARLRMVPRNYTLDTLAAATGIDASVLGKLLRGDRPLHLTHLAALERILGPLRPL